ncbi:hypothetical protein TVAG_226130 [Trichomonas vaginalis G3]|uniref:receptor protein-tyrosine kinase n=1 Tax=Trichomonas vaginalis (strain ATCC PRA-98 / G3) TaxID=412133 RepID=A2FSL2_TRIV3|nr:glycine-rich protein family [Trichomonas vaginalis G3]EAX92113.1 hypothetical protein TVAG_226130 [Trichomonas vaginalis G3]KAI5548635.1 glycine-rich protein family [Trichomonas vaginalis G3]|eukprot:XP_001305043.1 hypothetical protein [Trichomonas vaginalis G3]
MYKFESWGASGTCLGNPGNQGLGGYTSGIIYLRSVTPFYLFVGAHTDFNYKTNVGTYYARGGASSDIRLTVNSNFDWFDPESLRSRIMVSAGGGGAEWMGSIGGNAGDLEGSDGKTDCRNNGVICNEIVSKGANQLRGGNATSLNMFYDGTIVRQYDSYEGKFGRIVHPDGVNIGGMGGNGYYSGATLGYTGGGGGGSSFISGHEGCIALKSSLNENPSNSSIHYSELYFTQTQMIPGNETMPLYSSSNAKGKGNKNEGCIRITILTKDCSYYYNSYFQMSYFFPTLIFLLFDSK